MNGECIDEICLNAHEQPYHTNSDKECAEEGQSPLDVLVGTPSVDEKTCRNERSGDDERWKSVLRLHFAAILGCKTQRQLVGNGAEDDQAKEHADAGTDIHKANVAFSESVIIDEDEGESCEEQVPVSKTRLVRC